MPKKPLPQIRIEGNIAYVPLSQGYEAMIDIEDVPLVQDYHWYLLDQPACTTSYAIRNALVDGKRTTLRMHRVLMGDPPEMQIDHRDCNGLNNRRSNLRIATKSQNAMNRGCQKDNKCRIKGVFFDKRRNRWAASIKINRQIIHLGKFINIEDAADAYAKAAKELHADYMRLE